MNSSDENKTQNTAGPLEIAGELNIHSAVAVQRNLLEALSLGASGIDLSRVEACDAIGLQLLLSAKKSGLQIIAMAPAVVEAAAAIGIYIEDLNQPCSCPMQ